MKIKIYRVIAVLTALVIFILPMGVLAVDYPEGYSASQVEEIIPKVGAIVRDLLGDKLDSSTVYSAFCNDATVNSLFSAIYGEMTDSADTLALLGIDLTPEGLSESFSEYESVAWQIKISPDLKTAVAKADTFKWGVTDRDSFARAVATVFLPFGDVVYALLCGGEIKLNGLVSVTGGDGYESVIQPILKNLNCPSILTQKEFTRSSSDRRNMIVRIFTMLYSAIDNIFSDPINEAVDVLPKIAAFLNDGGLSDAINSLIEPLTLNIGSLSIPGISKLLSSVVSIENSADLSSLIGDMDLSSVAGVTLKLPEINLDDLAACATKSGDTYATDKSASFMTILYWLISALRENKSLITNMTGNNAEISDFVDKLLAKSDKELAAIVLYLFTNAGDCRTHDVTYTYPAYTPVAVNPPEGLTADQLQRVLDGIDPLITEAMQDSDENANITDTVKKLIYSNSVLKALSDGIYSIFGSSELSGLTSIIGVNPVYYRNGSITDGDSTAFRKQLVRLLTPYTTLFAYLFNEGKLTIAGGLELGGSDGYNTVIIPLLEGLGCSTDNIKTYSEYGKSDEKIITDIIDPIISLIDEICESPVKNICERIPELIYFLNSGLVKDYISELVYPVTALLDDAGLEGLIDLDSMLDTSLTDFDINSLLTDSSLTSDLGISLPEADLNKLMTCGTAVTLTSKRNGSPTYTYINGNSQEVLTLVLKYLVKILKSDENSGLLSGLMGSSEEGGNDMMAMAGDIGAKFVAMTDDELICWLYNLFFREKAVAETTAKDEFIPTIIYQKTNKVSVGVYVGIAVAVIVLALAVVLLLRRLGYIGYR